MRQPWSDDFFYTIKLAAYCLSERWRQWRYYSKYILPFSFFCFHVSLIPFYALLIAINDKRLFVAVVLIKNCTQSIVPHVALIAYEYLVIDNSCSLISHSRRFISLLIYGGLCSRLLQLSFNPTAEIWCKVRK